MIFAIRSFGAKANSAPKVRRPKLMNFETRASSPRRCDSLKGRSFFGDDLFRRSLESGSEGALLDTLESTVFERGSYRLFDGSRLLPRLLHPSRPPCDNWERYDQDYRADAHSDAVRVKSDERFVFGVFGHGHSTTRYEDCCVFRDNQRKRGSEGIRLSEPRIRLP
jgi:hypothetical protein